MAILIRPGSVFKLANAPIPTTAKKTVEDVLKMSGVTKFIDGNSGATHRMKNPTGNVVGQDDHGNVYMEDMTCQFGRHRWVVFANHDDYFDGAMHVAPEWHGWLHHINSSKGSEVAQQFRPAYHVASCGTTTGTENPYAPKGSWINKTSGAYHSDSKGSFKNDTTRAWGKYSAWNP